MLLFNGQIVIATAAIAAAACRLLLVTPLLFVNFALAFRQDLFCVWAGVFGKLANENAQ